MMRKLIVALSIVTLLVIGVAATTLFYLQGRRVKSAQPCWGRLLTIGSAKDQWAIDTKATSGTSVTIENILPYSPQMPTCHIAGAKYIIGRIGEEPACTVHGTLSHFNPDRY